MNYYFVTFTASGGLTLDQCESIKDLFEKNFEEYVGVKEHHLNGHLHMHVWYATKVKQTAKITQKFERWFKTLNIPVVKGVIIKNKRETNRIGLCHYMSKDNDKPYFIRKFQWTWIQEQAREDVKHRPKKLLLSEERIVGQYESVELVLQYAKSVGLSLKSMSDIRSVCGHMIVQKYRFDKVRLKPMCAAILARSTGSLTIFNSWFDIEVSGLEF